MIESESYSKMYCTDIIALIGRIAEMMEYERVVQFENWKEETYQNLHSRKWCLINLSRKDRKKFFRPTEEFFTDNVGAIWWSHHGLLPSWKSDYKYEQTLLDILTQAHHCKSNKMYMSTSHCKALFYWTKRVEKMEKETITNES